MKRKLLFAAMLIAGALGTLRAQTDVTSTYITNADFEGDYVRFLNINSDRGVEKPVGWSVEWTQSATNDQNGMTYVGSMNQDSQNWTAYQGNKAYFTRMRWANATLNLRQTMSNLHPGSYTLSFYATASKLNDGNGSASVSVAGQSKAITVGTSTGTSWTQYSINFTVTTNPYATIEVTASRTAGNFKFGIDNFTLTYDGSSYYSTILTKAQALYDDNADWAEGADALNTAITAATGKETVADKNAAIVALEEAMATFKETNTVDMTSRITNATFDSNISGWTTTGGDGNAFQHQTSSQTNFNGGFLEKWRNGWNGGWNQKNFDVSQTLSSLPNGEYTIKAAIIAVMQGSAETFSANNTAYSNKKHGGPYYIDDEKGVWLYGTSGENSGKAWANTKNGAFDGDGAEYKTATVKVENGSLTIGFKGIGSENGGTSLGTYANWIACDNWTLSYFGFDPTTLKAEITSLKADAAALLLNSDYDNVTGTERTNLSGVASLTYADEKKATLEALISTIEGRIDAFTSAKGVYDAYYEIRGIAVALSVTPGDAPANAAAAPAATHALNVAVYTATTAANIFDVTAIYNPSWSSMGTSSGQHWSGDTGISYADEWRGDTNPTTRTATVTLPAGKFILMSAGRGSDNTLATMSANGTTVTFASNGDVGLGINKLGAASFDAEDAAGFSNKDGQAENTGTGWEWRFIPVTLGEETAVTVTQTLTRLSGSAWGSFSDFKILKIGVVATSDDYDDLNDAIDAAEAKTLGFENGQYAPYNNVSALKALATAKAIDQSAANDQDVVQLVTTALASATWTANTENVDAIFNGNFSSDVEGDWGLTGWTRTNVWGQQRDDVPGSTTGYYNQGGSLQYGNAGVYTMPLAAYTTYKLTFKYGAWDGAVTPTISVLNGSNQGLAETLIQWTDTNYKTSMLSQTMFFKTGDAGNYVLTLAGNYNIVWTDVSLVKVADTDVVIDEASTTAPEIAYYQTVTLTRTLKSSQWNGFSVPFGFTVAGSALDGAEVKQWKSVNENEITLEDATTIVAGNPYLVKPASDIVNPTFSGVNVTNPEEVVKGDGDYKFKAHLYNTALATDGSVAYVSTSDSSIKKLTSGSIKGLRSIFNIPTGTHVKALVIQFEDSTDGILTVDAEGNIVEGAIYNLAGQRISAPQKGVNIINGKKVLVK